MEADLSIVIPVYNEEASIEPLYERIMASIGRHLPKLELIFVNDGSRDRSSEILSGLASSRPEVVVIEFTRNFGHQAAVTAGLLHAGAKRVAVIDCDLQDPPELLVQMWAQLDQGYDVVYGVRARRHESAIRTVCYAAFYRVLSRIATLPIPLDAGDFSMMTREVVDHINSLPERNRFVRGLRTWVGLRQIGIPYDRPPRAYDESKYSLFDLINLALDGLVSFGFKPLRVISLIGFLTAVTSAGLGSIYLFRRVVFGLQPQGFTTIIVAVLFLSGVQLLTMGVIGEYVGRIFDEVKQRPNFLIKAVRRYQAP